MGSVNGDRPPASYHRCLEPACGYVRVQMADVTDVQQLCRNLLAANARKNRNYDSSKLDDEDALGELQLVAWRAYRDWDPARCARFLPYVSTHLRYGLATWYREQLGRDLPKAHAVSVSIHPLERAAEHLDEYEARWDTEAGGDPRPLVKLRDQLAADDLELEAAAELEFELSDHARASVREFAVLVAQGYDYAEVAEMTGIPRAEVAARLREVRSELRP